MGRALTALLIALMFLPLVGAQAPTEPGIYNPNTSTPATMYFHINGFQDFPINTQRPSDAYAQAEPVGLATHSSCVDTGPGTQTFTSQSSHTYYGYSSPSYVQYDVDQDGKPRIHQERGISYDVPFDQSIEPMFKWYLQGSSRTVDEAGDQNPNQGHPVIPNVMVRAILREGDDVSVGNAKFNEGQILAQGTSDMATLAMGSTTDSPHVTATQDADGNWIYEFAFPMTYEKSFINKKESFNLRVDVFMENPVCDGPTPGNSGDYQMLDYVLVHTSPDYRPVVKWNIMNPIVIEALHPQFVGDDLVVHTASNSPWGSYDVQGDIGTEQPMVLEITGPSQPLSFSQVALVEHSLGHGLDEHFKAVAATWLWDYQTDRALDGDYLVTFTVQNDQYTAEAYAVATFAVGAGDGEICGRNLGETEDTCIKASEVNGSNGEDSPGIGFVALLGVIAMAGAAIRRRQ